MLDVVLYRRDRRGMLRLRERTFASLDHLARFFATAGARRWEWAEVAEMDGGGDGRVVRYESAALRAMAAAPRPRMGPSLN